MFAAPDFGWCRITIGQFDLSGSYLEDYPYTIPTAIVEAYGKIDKVSDTSMPLSDFIVDAESQGDYLVEFYCDRIEIWDGSVPYKQKELPLHVLPLDKPILKDMALEAARDLEWYMDEWLNNWVFFDENDEGKLTETGICQLEERERELSDLLAKLMYLSS